jgi:uncharacterized membrane protein
VRRALAAFALALALAPPAAGQHLPAAYRVTGVAADDVLNVRAGPGAGWDIVGRIAPFALHVEVLELSEDGRWGRVPLPEGSGWVAMRHLEPTPPDDPAALPRPLSCYGTEPFWHLGLFPRGAEWTTPDEGRIDLVSVEEAVAPAGFLGRFSAASGQWRDYTLTILREPCWDGMSDRPFGLSARLFLRGPAGNLAVPGCCSLDHR